MTITSFYESDGKTVKRDLFDTIAKEIAKTFISKDDKGKEIVVTSTQLRRIFDEVKRFEQLLMVSDDQWVKQLPYIKMIKSKVAYSVARAIKKSNGKDKNVYKNLESFISSGINLIQEKEDYHVFVNLFEAVYGFYYEMAPKNSQ